MIVAWINFAGMVRVQARRLVRAGFSVDELFTVGLWGLYQSSLRFNPERGIKFESYAQLRVRGEMLDWMEKNQREAATTSISEEHSIADRELARVDAIDSLHRMGIAPDARPPRRPDDLANSFRGRVFVVGACSDTLAGWARRIGIGKTSLKERILKFGPDKALTMGPGRKRGQCT